MQRFFVAALAAGLTCGAADAQTLTLRPAGRISGPVAAALGDTVQVDVWARLDSLAAAGIDLHLSLPAGSLALVDADPDVPGLQPFRQGDLFAAALELYNGSSDLVDAADPERQHLRYALVNSAGSARGVHGEGRVASFRVAVRGPLDRAQLRIEDTPVRETRLVLSDGTTQRRFEACAGLELSAPPAGTAVAAASWGDVKRAAAF